MTDGARAAALGLGAAALFCGGFAWLTTATAYHPAFDDAEHVRAGLLWSRDGRLDTSGGFLRVPLWQVLLGTLFDLWRPGVAIALLQVGCVLGAIGLACRHAVREGTAARTLALGAPLALFALAPQTLLYARHAVNELFIGVLVCGVLHLGTRRALRPGAALAIGVAVGAAAMTKLSMAVLGVPALVFAWRGASDERALRLGALALGAALVALPLVALHHLQRPGLPLDTTSAYTLGPYMPAEWLALGDHAERRRAGLAAFREALSSDPLGYAAAAASRLARWIVRPATADFALFAPGFPTAAAGLAEHLVLWILVALAALGTGARELPIWSFVLALPLLCAFPVHVPFTPKILPVFPCLLLAPAGIARLSAALRPADSRDP